MGNGPRDVAVTRLRELVKPWIPFKRGLRQAQQQIAFGHGLRRYAIELYHEPNYVPLRYDVPVVVTIHDLSWLRYPETHPADRVRWLERGLPRALERASMILVDSQFVRDEVLTNFSVLPERVSVAHLGVSPAFRPHSTAETASVLQPLRLAHGKYLLTVGTIEPRKNIAHVLKGYALLPEHSRERYPLVVVGARGWRAAELERELRLLTDRGQIRFLGHASGGDLPKLYAGAAAFIFPSLYEGFGLPPLEAMASGVPVLASNRGSLPEVLGHAGIAVDPEAPEDTAVKMASLLEDPQARDAYRRLGIARARHFTWTACAEATAQAYRKALGGTHL